jgi:iron complex transport system ATP-binding protein
MGGVAMHKACAAPWGYPLLENIELELGGGDILGIVGPNGAGKSSLLGMLSGQIPLSGGSLSLNGKPVADWQPLERARAVAVLPQHSALNFPFTVEQVILLSRTPHATGNTIDRQVVEAVMGVTDTQALRQRLYTQLSGGERQRVQLARVVAQLWRGEDAPARMLLLDEPTNALDPAHQQMVLGLITQLAADGVAVALVMHDFNLVATVADQVMVLDSGRSVATGTPLEVFTEDMFEQVFKVSVHRSLHPVSGRPMVFPA